MRLLQLNVWNFRLANQVVELTQKESPDIVTWQEVLDSENELGLSATLTHILDKTRFHHQYLSPTYSFKFFEGTADFGNAIVSNLELLEKYQEFTHSTYKENFSFEQDDYNARNFQHVVAVDQNGKKFHVINHHGYHVPGHKKGNDFTLRACRQIAEYAATLEGPIIITGDFNLEPSSESLTVLNAAFRNLSVEYNLQTTRNSLTSKQEVCDYIFVNDQVEVQDFYVSDVMASDHQGLVLDFEVKNTI